MKKKWILITVTGILATALTTAAVSFGKSEEREVSGGSIQLENRAEVNFPSMAKIKMEQAMQTALAEVPGKLLKAGLEDENNFLVYGIEVVTPDRTIMEVKVDAGTGKILVMNQDKIDDDEHDFDDRDYDRDRED
jgi:uncharacterized membrane protein YkoI